MENLMIFTSMTTALKARDLLRKHGIGAQVVRTPAKLRKGSCGYSLVVTSNFDKAKELIKESKIPLSGVGRL